ncbi:MAG: hypothetical protein L0332_33375 [Chloroflexi bacterium]|nr:hypothetical protein [Chloroflexota bacterium]MCI0577286.1 hypothetical protein [Chloroflexota bacterium]MCI0647730.1 hypothetical protein [Chloroflexota bacterium]MCI0731594.1 hypothetical protein [Chloroflexota bacterium]
MGSSSTNVRYLLTRGVAAAKAGDTDEARFYLNWVLRTEASGQEEIEACFWLSEIAEEPIQKRRYLEDVLARNPLHADARRKLAILNGQLNPADVVDPERPARPAPQSPQPAASQRFTCPQCAARMVFTPDGQSLYCEHCGYQQAPGAAPAENEQDFIIAMATAQGHQRPVVMQAFQCHNCTASFVLAPNTLSLTCPYCTATYAIEATQTRELVPPQGIIPFATTQEAAQKAIRAWLDKRKIGAFAPAHGIYLPAWLFDVGGESRWQGYQGYDTAPQSGWGYDGPTPIRRPVSGSVPVLEHNVLVPAGRTLPKRLAGTLRHFDLAQVVAYDPRYLADWPAQTYEIAVGDASLVARRHVLDEIREWTRRMAAENGVSNVQVSSAGMQVESFQLVLLPVWIGHYTVDGRTYTVVANGQSGAVLGELPPGGLRGWLNRLLGDS